jgi:hypothetical protein
MFRPSRIRRARLCLIATVVMTGVLAVASPAAAREAVNPATLTPPQPAYLESTCGWSGLHVMCLSTGSFTVTDAATGIFCSGSELLESSDRYVAGQRIYNANLDLVERRVRERIEGVLYDPATGRWIRWTGADTGVLTLSIPGDPGSGVGVDSGAILHFYLDNGRSVVVAGRTTENFDTGDFIQVGHDPSFDLCGALHS